MECMIVVSLLDLDSSGVFAVCGINFFSSRNFNMSYTGEVFQPQFAVIHLT